jgi:hypothetical protein
MAVTLDESKSSKPEGDNIPPICFPAAPIHVFNHQNLSIFNINMPGRNDLHAVP